MKIKYLLLAATFLAMPLNSAPAFAEDTDDQEEVVMDEVLTSGSAPMTMETSAGARTLSSGQVATLNALFAKKECIIPVKKELMFGEYLDSSKVFKGNGMKVDTDSLIFISRLANKFGSRFAVSDSGSKSLDKLQSKPYLNIILSYEGRYYENSAATKRGKCDVPHNITSQDIVDKQFADFQKKITDAKAKLALDRKVHEAKSADARAKVGAGTMNAKDFLKIENDVKFATKGIDARSEALTRMGGVSRDKFTNANARALDKFLK